MLSGARLKQGNGWSDPEGMATAASATGLEAIDGRPLLVSMLGGGWLLLCGFGALRALIVLASYLATSAYGVPDPMAQLAVDAPDLVGEATLERLAQQADIAFLDRALAGPLLLAAILGVVGALRLLQCRSWSRGLLAAAGLLSIAITAVHGFQSVEIWTRHAVGVEGFADARDALRAVAAINLSLQSIPVILGLALLRHPIVVRFVLEPAVETRNA